MTTIFLTGKDGQLGWELLRTLSTVGKVVAFDRASLDLSDHALLRATIHKVKPDLIVNAAAYTAVDKAEKEQDTAISINATAPGIMAEEAKSIGAALIHYSTDYVFDGSQETPYLETDRTNPINRYGESKLMGEQTIQEQDIPYLIFRTSWVYSHRGNNFLITMLKLMQERDSLNIVNDQFGSPTLSRSIAEVSGQILSKYFTPDLDLNNLKKQSGVYNLTSSGKTSWYEFAMEIREMAAKKFSIPVSLLLEGIPSDQYPVPAKRPKYSQLSLDKITDTFGVVCPDWKESLALCMESVSHSKSTEN